MTKILLAILIVITVPVLLVGAQEAYADVISHFPGHLGDPSFSTELTSLGMSDVASSETTQTTFFVPGSGSTTLTFTFQSNGGGFVGSFGFYDVSTVTANPITQKALYTTQALGGATLVFDDALVNPGAVAPFLVAGGTELGFFLIPDASLATYLASPGIFLVNGGIIEDSPLFSVSNANDGQFDQLQSFADNANTLFGWEDITRTGNGKLGASDNDFEDLVFSVDAILPIPVDVDIDIKPGSDPSSVNCKNTKGSVPVAIFGSADYDVSTIDLSSLELNEVDVDEVHDKLHMDDINNDGFDDVVLHLDKAGVCNATNENTLKESVGATLTGSTTDDPPVDFTGTGDIRIVKR